MPDDPIITRIWTGTGAAERLARVAMLPLSAVFRAATTVRSALYDSGILAGSESAIPVVSVGNLTVGGTGKTPIAAWVAHELHALGMKPAIVLRGYGDDEQLVHRVLNPDVLVEVAAERRVGIAAVAAQGATVAVLDDAFQHREAARTLDLVLVSADSFTENRLPLPAGPWREPLGALRRASAAIITRKAAADESVTQVRASVAASAPGIPVAVVRLEPSEIRELGGDGQRPLRDLDGKRVLAIAAIGDPRAFLAQLKALGARCSPRVFADHHAFSDAEIRALVAEGAGHDLVVSTLKDAVKLAPRWPRATVPAWYVSQRVFFEEGEGAIRRLLDGIRASASSTDFTGTPSASR